MSAQTETVKDVPVQGDSVEVPKEEGFRVFIGGLQAKTTEDEVREFASKSGGEILSVVIPPLRFKRSPGFAFVHYKTEDQAKEAVEKLNDTQLGERKVSLQIARSKEEQAERREAIIAKRKAHKAEREEKAKAEKKEEVDGETTAVEGDVKPKKKRASKTSRRRLPGQEDEEAEADGAQADTSDAAVAAKTKPKRKPKAKKAKDATEARIDGDETTEEKAAKPPKAKKERKPRLEQTGEQSDNTIFVANLPFSVDDAALAAIFTNLSIRVKSAKVVTGLRSNSRTGRRFRASRGFGFVEIEEPSQQKEAVEKVEGSLIGDRKISAKIAQEVRPVEEETAAEAAAEQAEKSEQPAA